jgi:hypothetical protein
MASIGAAAIKNADVLAAKLTAKLATQTQQAEPPRMDWKTILVDVGQFLVDNGLGLVETDEELEKQRRLQRQLRFQRDDATAQIRTQLRGLRYLLDEAFGKEKSKQMFPARTDHQRLDAKALLRVAVEGRDVLRGQEYSWPDLSGLGHLATPASLLASLESSIPLLATAVDGLRPEKTGVDHALGNKTRELEATVDAMQRGADFLFGLFRYASFDFEADRLKPRRRKARSPAKPEEMPPVVPPAMPPVVQVPPRTAPVLARPLMGFLPPLPPAA